MQADIRSSYVTFWHVGKGQLQQDRQCTCNVTLRHIRATIVTVEIH